MVTMILPKSSPRSLYASSNKMSSVSSFWLVFILGCFLGHWHGRLSTIKNNETRMILPFLAAAPTQHHRQYYQPATYEPSVIRNEGWRTIHVFHGRPEQPSERIVSMSQAHQDELIWGLLHNQTGGYFVDLAANDAIYLSNTYLLEQRYKWKGICIEPNEMYWKNLSFFRTCDVYGAVLGRQQFETVYFRFEAGDHGGISDTGFDNGKRWQKSSDQRQTTTLLDILERADAPSQMDYLSLDVEGAESFIMLDFPFSKYSFKIITAERLKGEIRSVLNLNGYEFVEKLTRWGESLWVHNSTKATLDWSVMNKFDFPL